MSDAGDQAAEHRAELAVNAPKTPHVELARPNAVHHPTAQGEYKRKRQKVCARDPLNSVEVGPELCRQPDRDTLTTVASSIEIKGPSTATVTIRHVSALMWSVL